MPLRPRLNLDHAERPGFATDRAAQPPAPLAPPQKTAGGAVIYTLRAARVHPDGDPLRYAWGEEHRDADELAKMRDRIVGRPVVVYHPPPSKDGRDQTVAESGQTVVGHAVSARIDGDHLVVEAAVMHPDGLEAVARGIREVSLGYESRLDDRRYQRDVQIDHIALVPRARCGPTCELRADATAMTKCPACGAEATPGKPCPECGKMVPMDMKSDGGGHASCKCGGACNTQAIRMDPEQIKKIMEDAAAQKMRADKAEADLKVAQTALAVAEAARDTAQAEASQRKDAIDAHAQALKDAEARGAATALDRVATESVARAVLGPDKDGKARKFDGQDTLAIKRDVIRHADGKDVPADKASNEIYVAARFDAVAARVEDGARGSDAVRGALGTGAGEATGGTRLDAATAEKKAMSDLKSAIGNQWKQPQPRSGAQES